MHQKSWVQIQNEKFVKIAANAGMPNHCKKLKKSLNFISEASFFSWSSYAACVPVRFGHDIGAKSWNADGNMRTPSMGSATCFATIRWFFLDPFKINDLRLKSWREGNFFLEPSFFSWSQNIWLGEIISVRLCIRTFNGGFPFHFWIALQLCWQNQMEILDTQNPTKLVKLNQTFLSWLHSGEVFWTKILQWMPGLCGFCPQGLLMLLGNSQC